MRLDGEKLLNDLKHSDELWNWEEITRAISSGTYTIDESSNQGEAARLREAFPRQPEWKGGWTIDPDYLVQVSREIDKTPFEQLADSQPSLEQIEMVLLAIEALSSHTEDKP